MKTKLLFSLVAFLALPAGLLAQGKAVPAETVFRDATATPPSDKILSDGLSGTYGNYPGGINCVVDQVAAKGGGYFLRTVYPYCTPAVQRSINLDFSDAASTRTPDGSGSDSCHVNDAFGQTGELDICGSNTLPDVRIIATLFGSTTLKGHQRDVALQPDGGLQRHRFRAGLRTAGGGDGAVRQRARLDRWRYRRGRALQASQ